MKNINFNFYQLLALKKGTNEYINGTINATILEALGSAKYGLTLADMMKRLKGTQLRACDVRRRLKKLVNNNIVVIDDFTLDDEPVYMYCD